MCQTNQESYDMHAPGSAHWTAKKNRDRCQHGAHWMHVSIEYVPHYCYQELIYGFDNEDFWTSPKTYVKFFEQSCQCSQRN
jgi:hypothetical protein